MWPTIIILVTQEFIVFFFWGGGGALGIITCTLLHSAHAHEHTKSIELISEKTLSLTYQAL